MIDHLLSSILELIPYQSKHWYCFHVCITCTVFTALVYNMLLWCWLHCRSKSWLNISGFCELTVLFVIHNINQIFRLQEFTTWIQSYVNVADYQWKICHSCVCTTVYIVAVCCPSVLWPRKAPTDNRLLAGWWLRKATRRGVVMATEACQTDCVEIGQVWTHNQYPPPSTPIWHF